MKNWRLIIKVMNYNRPKKSLPASRHHIQQHSFLLFFLKSFLFKILTFMSHKSQTQHFSLFAGPVISFSYGTYLCISWALPEGRKCPLIICANIFCFLKGHYQPSTTIRVRNWPGLPNGALTRHSPTQTQRCLSTLEMQCPGVKELKYSAPVILSYGFSPQPIRLLVSLSESRTNTRPMCL